MTISGEKNSVWEKNVWKAMPRNVYPLLPLLDGAWQGQAGYFSKKCFFLREGGGRVWFKFTKILMFGKFGKTAVKKFHRLVFIFKSKAILFYCQ